jgi:hydrogenase/urease accessory protein HupE
VRQIVVDALFDAIPSHVHFAQVERADGTEEHVLSADHRVIALQTPQAAPLSWPTFMRTGVRHVFGGLDHLVFLLALALLVRSRRQLLWLVSGFTLGHAISMSLVVLGVITAHAGTVEALIGASILLLGVELAWRQRQQRHLPMLVGLGLVLLAAAAGAWRGSVRPLALVGLALMSACYVGWRWRRRGAGLDQPHPSEALLTITFGAVHGLGFASALGVLSTQHIVAPLLAFNIGVELAQLGVVLAALLLLGLAERLGKQALLLQLGASAASCAGAFWLLLRVLAP